MSDPSSNDFSTPGIPQDKTFVEGQGGAAPSPHNLTPGARLNTSSGTPVKNPFSATQTGRAVPDLKEGVSIGSGTVVSVLGAGGMAKIYRIWNEKLEVHRAIKIMLPSQQQELLQRFETEAKITAKLHHPNIVEIYMVGDFNGLPFIEMEFIDGWSLDAVVNHFGKLPPAVSTAIGILIGRALSYAHNQEFLLYGTMYHGVIHRDLKPANIMISTKGVVKLMDFGIARPTETSLHTVDGNIVGTMQYLSPEQLDAGEIDGRTDIYSFGAILYEMITGTKTFPQTTMTKLLKMKSINEYRSLSGFQYSIPQSLVKITEKCLELSKEDRFKDADEMLEALEKAHFTFTADEPDKVIAKFLSSPEYYSGGKFKNARKFLLPGSIAVSAFAGIAVTIILLFFTRPQQSAHITTPITHSDTSATQRKEPVPAPAPQNNEPDKPVEPFAGHTRELRPARKPVTPPVQTGTEKTNRKVPAGTIYQELSSKYETSDMALAARRALDKGNADDAIAAIGALPASYPEQEKKNLLLLEAFVMAGKMSDARSLTSRISSDDALFDLLRGNIEERSANESKALGFYQSALTRPSTVRETQGVRQDALYLSALIYDRRYRASPTAETRMQSLNAWNVVKRAYFNNPEHPRFKTANNKLASIN